MRFFVTVSLRTNQLSEQIMQSLLGSGYKLRHSGGHSAIFQLPLRVRGEEIVLPQTYQYPFELAGGKFFVNCIEQSDRNSSMVVCNRLGGTLRPYITEANNTGSTGYFGTSDRYIALVGYDGDAMRFFVIEYEMRLANRQLILSSILTYPIWDVPSQSFREPYTKYSSAARAALERNNTPPFRRTHVFYATV